MQEYLELQNKLRKELSNKWIEYYQVDGLAKQKGSKINFTPSTALQGIMYEISKQLEEMEQSLRTKFPNESDSQQKERMKVQINDKLPKLVEQHKNAVKNGILGKDETWDKLINRYPELKAFVKKYGHLRDNEKILYSLSSNPNDYETNLAKANLAKEYESAEFVDIMNFLRNQRDEIEQLEKLNKAERELKLIADREIKQIADREAMKQIEDKQDKSVADLRAQYYNNLRDKQNLAQLPAIEYYNDDDDADTVAQHMNKKKNNSQLPRSPTKQQKKSTNKPHGSPVSGKKSHPSKTPSDTDDDKKKKRNKDDDDEYDEAEHIRHFEEMFSTPKPSHKSPTRIEEVFDNDNNNDDDDERQVTRITKTEQARMKREQQRIADVAEAERRGFDTVEEMKKEDSKKAHREKALERYHSMTDEQRQKLRDQQNANNAKKREQKKEVNKKTGKGKKPAPIKGSNTTRHHNHSNNNNNNNPQPQRHISFETQQSLPHGISNK